MSKINLLSEDLINKIAAGEVIERPASVVKELIENSLDAKATQITITIENAGKDLICVQDNGEGMDEEDARKSILRHATSKIRSVEDLFSISTLGFRGEALASIAAVSKLSLITKQQEALGALQLLVDGGVIESSNIVAADKGTAIAVRNLFFNTPARKKFLKSDVVELKHILDIVTQYSLLHHLVGFKVFHNGREVLHSPIVQDPRANAASVFGVAVAKELLDISYSTGFLIATGFIGKPYAVRNDKSQQVLFINNRWVRNEDITKAVYEGYHSLLFTGKHPIFVLHVQLDPAAIDVNVHPHKSEVKIEQKNEVCQLITQAVKETLQKNNLIPVVAVEQEAFQDSTVSFSPSSQKIAKESVKYPFEPARQTMLMVNEVNEEIAPAVEQKTAEKREIELDVNSSPLLQSSLPPIKLLGQFHKTFFAAETEGGVLFIDQHAAHERVLYERFMEQFMKKEIQVQSLLQGETIDCSAGEKELVLEYQEFLIRLGFIVDYFGGSSFVIKAIPSVFGRTQSTALLRDVLAVVQEYGNVLDDVKEEIITRMACRAAIMAGEEITISAMETIMEQLSLTKLPYTCPHGRPTIIKTTAEELEKKFRRRG